MGKMEVVVVVRLKNGELIDGWWWSRYCMQIITFLEKAEAGELGAF